LHVIVYDVTPLHILRAVNIVVAGKNVVLLMGSVLKMSG